MNLNYSKIIPTEFTEYFITIHLILLFSREAPKIYYKLINSKIDNARTIIKAICLWKIDIFNYVVVFNLIMLSILLRKI